MFTTIATLPSKGSLPNTPQYQMFAKAYDAARTLSAAWSQQALSPLMHAAIGAVDATEVCHIFANTTGAALLRQLRCMRV